MTGGWTAEDSQILLALGWRIVNRVANTRNIRLEIKISHWPKAIFEPSQRWAATLNA